MINILRQTKEFFVELMNRLHYFIAQPIDWYNGLDESIFFFLVLLENTAFDLVFCSLQRDSSLGTTSGETTSRITLVCLFVF